MGDIQVYDAEGHIVTTAKDVSRRYDLSTASWPTGLYLIRSFGTDSEVLVTRWIVE